jgi:hypothetical protein
MSDSWLGGWADIEPEGSGADGTAQLEERQNGRTAELQNCRTAELQNCRTAER